MRCPPRACVVCHVCRQARRTSLCFTWHPLADGPHVCLFLISVHGPPRRCVDQPTTFDLSPASFFPQGAPRRGAGKGGEAQAGVSLALLLAGGALWLAAPGVTTGLVLGLAAAFAAMVLFHAGEKHVGARLHYPSRTHTNV